MPNLKPISGFTRYFAGDDGHIYRRIESKRSPNYPLKRLGFLSPYGYTAVAIVENGKEVETLAHILIAEAFHGPKPTPAHEVRHLNGKKRDNRPDNLCWGTRAENEADKVGHGKANIGERNGRSILTMEAAERIRALRSTGRTIQSLADEFGISYSTAKLIIDGKTWSAHD